jgi:hypothetical protein
MQLSKRFLAMTGLVAGALVVVLTEVLILSARL